MKTSTVAFAYLLFTLAASAAQAQTPPSPEQCKKILRAQYESWVAKHPQSSNHFFNLRRSQDEPLCTRCQEEVGKKLTGWISAPDPVAKTTESVYLSGCVAFRSDLFGTQEGAVCILRQLGDGYRLSGAGGAPTCGMDGHPYTITARTPPGTKPDIEGTVETPRPAGQAKTLPSPDQCQGILRAQYEAWVAKYPQHSTRFFNLRSPQDEPLCTRCQLEVGKKLTGWISAPDTHADPQEKSGYLAGCVAFRPDIFATQEGAACIIRQLGDGYRLSTSGGTPSCGADGFPYTITPRTPPGTKPDIEPAAKTPNPAAMSRPAVPSKPAETSVVDKLSIEPVSVVAVGGFVLLMVGIAMGIRAARTPPASAAGKSPITVLQNAPNVPSSLSYRNIIVCAVEGLILGLFLGYVVLGLFLGYVGLSQETAVAWVSKLGVAVPSALAGWLPAMVGGVIGLVLGAMSAPFRSPPEPSSPERDSMEKAARARAAALAKEAAERRARH